MPRFLNLHLGATFAFLYIPIAVLIVLSFNKAGLPTAWSGFSVEWYGRLAANPKILASAWNSVIVATISTLIATVLGTLLALGVERAKPSPARDALLFAPMIVPDIVLAIALLSFFTLIKFTLGLHSIILAHVVFNIAFVCAVVRARLKGFDWSLTEVSRDLGAGHLVTFRKITLPLIFAPKQSADEEKNTMKGILSRTKSSRKAALQVRTFIEKYEGLELSRYTAAGYIKEAKRQLDVFEDCAEKKHLITVADYILSRNV